MSYITINKEEVIFYDSTFIRLIKPYIDFDKSKLVVDYMIKDNIPTVPVTVSYNLKLGYSIDGKNYTNHVSKETFTIPEELAGVSLFISILLEKQLINSLNITPSELHYDENVTNEKYQVTLNRLAYDTVDIVLNDYESVKYITYRELISQYPNWNLYDNQDINVLRWISQCNAISEMYGHKCVYFKTSPVETNNTLRQHYLRNVVAIKKIMLMFPDNNIGSPDKIMYSEWDMPLSDDFMVHILWDKFKTSFGEDAIPNERDYIYIPLLNKLFTLGVVQPINGFMGKVAWWEGQLFLYEDDAHVGVSDVLKEEIGGIPEFDKALDLLGAGDLLDLDGISNVEPLTGENVLEKIEDYTSRNLNTKEKIGEKTIFEKRKATDSYTNILEDSTWYVSMKESEKVREFYHTRLKISKVNPGLEMYPLNMYNCSDVDLDTIAMRYTLLDFTGVSKIPTKIATTFELEFIMAVVSKFNGRIVNFMNTDTSVFDISMNRSYQIIVNGLVIDFTFEPNELYYLKFSYDKQYDETPQVVIYIYYYNNGKKDLVYQTISLITNPLDDLTSANICGGNYLIGKIKMDVNSKNIYTDNCNPLLVMNRITMT